MNLEETEIAIIFKNDKKSIADFFADFSKKYINFRNKSIILDFSTTKEVLIENILLFLPLSEQHRNHGMSFVIIANGIEVDDVPDEIVIVPTLKEAKDLIEMEDIERNLGF